MILRPKKYLEYYSKLYPSAWKQVDMFRSGRGKDLDFWPEWCFLPLAGAYAIVSYEAQSQGIDITSEKGIALINDVGIIGALAAWRVTQGVYRFDPDLYKELVNTPITGDLPHEVLFNLPEWCVYIETPEVNVFGQELCGFFAYLEYDVNEKRKELRMVMDYAGEKILHSTVIHLGPWPLKEAIKKANQEARRHSEKLGIDFSNADNPEYIEYVQTGYAPLVSLLLYLCSFNSEIKGEKDRKPQKPRTKKTKKGHRMFPPPKVSTWDVGLRIGAALRRAKEYNERETSGIVSQKQRTSPRPHIRRAHWHGYWSGPRDGERKFQLKWIPPVLVGSGDDDNMPVTIRPVE